MGAKKNRAMITVCLGRGSRFYSLALLLIYINLFPACLLNLRVKTLSFVWEGTDNKMRRRNHDEKQMVLVRRNVEQVERVSTRHNLFLSPSIDPIEHKENVNMNKLLSLAMLTHASPCLSTFLSSVVKVHQGIRRKIRNQKDRLYSSSFTMIANPGQNEKGAYG